MKRKLYISGPMSGISDFNFPAFHDAAKYWRLVGWEVFNPAEQGADVPPAGQYAAYLPADIRAVLGCDAVLALPGWENSRGAVLEIALAVLLGKSICSRDGRVLDLKVAAKDGSLHVAELRDEPEESIAQEAHRLVHGDRQGAYGHPIEDFTRTGTIWSAILGIPVSPEQVALCMMGVKISREVNKHHRDNLTDACGYSLCLDRIHRRKVGLE